MDIKNAKLALTKLVATGYTNISAHRVILGKITMEQNLLFARRGLSNPRLAGGFVNPPGATWKATFAVLRKIITREASMFLLEEVENLYDKFADAVYKPNVLDGKTKELIALSNSVVADCVPCIHWHYRQAVKYGASKEEIAEALAIAMSVSAGSKRAKYAPVIKELAESRA